jgi:hypothetical protein
VVSPEPGNWSPGDSCQTWLKSEPSSPLFHPRRQSCGFHPNRRSFPPRAQSHNHSYCVNARHQGSHLSASLTPCPDHVFSFTPVSEATHPPRVVHPMKPTKRFPDYLTAKDIFSDPCVGATEPAPQSAGDRSGTSRSFLAAALNPRRSRLGTLARQCLQQDARGHMGWVPSLG